MTPWTKVVTDPLGLAGYSLFLIFGFLGQLKRNDERRWIPRVALSAAIVALVGGLALSYFRTAKSVPSSSIQLGTRTETNQQQTGNISQSNTGNGNNNVQGVQGNVTIVQNLAAGNPPPEPSRDRAGSAPRPWLAIEGLYALTPLTFNPAGGASAGVKFTLRDNGIEPAADVDVRGSLFSMSFMSFSREQMKEAEAAFCDRFRTQQDQAIKFSLYPSRPIAQTVDANLNQIYLDKAINKSVHGLFPGMSVGQIPVALIVCVDYRSPSAKEHHQSQYALQFVIPGGRVGNSISQFKGGFDPKGTYPDAVVIGMDQNID